MLTCKQISDFLMDYDNGDLAAAVRAEFDRHLACCPPCVNYLKTFHETISLSKAACCDDHAPPVPDELVKAILASLKKQQ